MNETESEKRPYKVFQAYTHEQRSDISASFRLGYKQRQQNGFSFWVHPQFPGIAFETRKSALRYAELNAKGGTE
jgi:hypothetical protein